MNAPIVIAGGGVGGLTAALALAAIGRASLVLERAPEFREVGAGLQLAPNATRILRDLGVLELLNGLAVAPQYIRIRRGADGADLAKISLAEAKKSLWRALFRHPPRRSARGPAGAGAGHQPDRNPLRFDADRLSSRMNAASPSPTETAANSAAPRATR